MSKTLRRTGSEEPKYQREAKVAARVEILDLVDGAGDGQRRRVSAQPRGLVSAAAQRITASSSSSSATRDTIQRTGGVLVDWRTMLVV